MDKAFQNFDEKFEQLCQWAVQCEWDDIPSVVKERALMLLCDDISAMVAGSVEPEVSKFREIVLSRSTSGDSVIFAQGLPTADRISAAAVNALAGNWCELDGGFRRAVCHAGVCTLPALLAEGQARALTFAQLLRCVVLSYEIITRIAMTFKFDTMKVHSHAMWSSMGSAASVVLARNGTVNELIGAITAAATTTPIGPRRHLMEGVLVRNCWASAGAVHGFLSADWSASGIMGSSSSIPAVFMEILEAKMDPQALISQIGNEWSLNASYHKIYACCQHGHSSIEAVLAMLDLAQDFPLINEIAAIDVYTFPLALSLNNSTPPTTLGAKFSLPHMVAAALIYKTGGPRAFYRDTLSDEAVAILREKVNLMPFDKPLIPPNDRPSKIVIKTYDGKIFEQECLSSQGGPDRPFSQDVVLKKINDLSAVALPGLVYLAASFDMSQATHTSWKEILSQAQEKPINSW
jgi:2-methylcitrate dehydratase PrpD